MRAKILFGLAFTILLGLWFIGKSSASTETVKQGLVSPNPILVWAEKDVKVTPRGLKNEFKYQMGIQLDGGDTVFSGAKSYGVILFPSNTLVVINPLSKVEINKFEPGKLEELSLVTGSITVCNRDENLINRFKINSNATIIENDQFKQFQVHVSHREDDSLLIANFSKDLNVKSKKESNIQEVWLSKDKYLEANYTGRLGSIHSFNDSFQRLREMEMKRIELFPNGDELEFILRKMKKIAIPRKLNN